MMTVMMQYLATPTPNKSVLQNPSYFIELDSCALYSALKITRFDLYVWLSVDKMNSEFFNPNRLNDGILEKPNFKISE
jgi:hypothetical protein